MKRTPLTRKSRLKRTGWLKRGRRKPVGVIVADIWREGLHEERCVVCGIGRNLDGHHAIPKRVLRRLGFGDYVMDKRNRVPACRHDHESHENRHRPIRRDELPASVFEFARDLCLEWYLDRHYPACVCGEINMRHCAVHGAAA